MTGISDTRRLRVRRVVSSNGELRLDQGADVWQEKDGKLRASGLWEDLLVLANEDNEIQAARMGVSPLEWFRMRLMRCSAVVIEVA